MGLDNVELGIHLGAYDFADYAETLAKSLGDRVKYWITLNEPWEHAMMGHFVGEQAPGKHSPWAYFRVAHHQLLGHGLAVERIKTLWPDSQVGITLSQFRVYPQKDSLINRQAAHFADLYVNRFFLDGLFRGEYPEELWKRLKLFKPPIQPGDLEIISRPFDFLGVNYYSPMFAYHDWRIPFFQAWIERRSFRARLHARMRNLRRARRAVHLRPSRAWDVRRVGIGGRVLRVRARASDAGGPGVRGRG